MVQPVVAKADGDKVSLTRWVQQLECRRVVAAAAHFNALDLLRSCNRRTTWLRRSGKLEAEQGIVLTACSRIRHKEICTVELELCTRHLAERVVLVDEPK